MLPKTLNRTGIAVAGTRFTYRVGARAGAGAGYSRQMSSITKPQPSLLHPSPLHPLPTPSSPPPWSEWRVKAAEETFPSKPPPATNTDATSKDGTFTHQHNLPPLPIPKLQRTIERVLQSAQPFSSSGVGDFSALQQKAHTFLNGGASEPSGEELQQRLEKHRDEVLSKAELESKEGGEGKMVVKNWLAEWWDQGAYMGFREPVVANVSYYYGFKRLPSSPPSSSPSSSSQSTSPSRSKSYLPSTIVTTALSFRRSILDGKLEPDKIGMGKDGKGGKVIDMESYKWAFGGCRIPSFPSDYATITSPSSSSPSTDGDHITVIRHNRFWKVDIDEKRDLDGWRRVFEWIYDNTPAPDENGGSGGAKVGVLTGGNRDRWAEANQHIQSLSSQNLSSLHSLRTAAFVICLDPSPSSASSPTSIRTDRYPSTEEENVQMGKWSKRLWVGGERGELGGNRWWDQGMQWVIDDDGEVGFIGEHSCMDGTPTSSLNDYLLDRLVSNNPHNPSLQSSSSTNITEIATMLSFDLDDKAKAYIGEAESEFERHVGSYQVGFWRFRDYGKEGIKKVRVSPDGWVQMVIQLAYAMTHGHPCGTYESAMTRRFHLGRTECVRTCTQESVAWVESMLDPKKTNLERKEAFGKAIASHGREMRAAIEGMGIDRHLLGLKMVLKPDEKVPEIFTDPLVAKSSTWNLSTSQVDCKNYASYGWGPVVNDGYGVPYMIHSDSLLFTVTGKQHMPTSKMIENMVKAARMMMEVMTKAIEEEEARAPAKSKL